MKVLLGVILGVILSFGDVFAQSPSAFQSMELSDEVFANRYTLVFFWGSWHDGAKEQFAALSGALDKYRSSGLQMVGVSLDGSVAACKAFVEEQQVAWPQLCNPSGGSAEVAAAYGVTSLPAAVLINNRGTIIARMSTTLDVLKKFEELF